MKVQKIIHLQKIINQSSDIFTNSKKVIKSNISIKNTFVKINVLEGYIEVLQINLKLTYLNKHFNFKCHWRLNNFHNKIQPLEEIIPEELTFEESETIENLKLKLK